jgi:manganese transport protein
MFAFAGPAYMVAVGYMDPGNWATDIAGGSEFGYQLIWVLLMSNVMAVLLQTLSARLGLVTGRDLAQACHDEYPQLVRYVLFVLCEIAIAACDLAEVLGSAIGLNLLFGLPVLWGVVLTGADVLVLLAIQRLGIRKMEAFIILLISVIGVCFLIEVVLSRPSATGIVLGLVPRPLSGKGLYVAIGILGATVMPHNLYLHSALVQSRDVTRSRQAVAEACWFNFVDSAIALNCAFFVNAAILIVAAAAFWSRGIVVSEIQQAHGLLNHTLGTQLAPIVFAVALLCAGQSSTVTGTLAGQITMEGFLRFRVRPWLRRLITRLLAIVPAVAVILFVGDEGVYKLLLLSQVVLSMQLSFAVVPLVKFTGSKQKMGPFVSRWWLQGLAWLVAAIITALNGKLLFDVISEWVGAAGRYGWLVGAAVVPVTVGLVGLLIWMCFRREQVQSKPLAVSAEEVAAAVSRPCRRFNRIGVALEARSTDAAILAEAVTLARLHRAELILMHIVEGVGGQWYGAQTGDLESREDENYLQTLAVHLRQDLAVEGVPVVEVALGYGNVPGEIVRLGKERRVDLLVLGGHGHKGIADWLHGETIQGVRHGLSIPMLTVRD